MGIFRKKSGSKKDVEFYKKEAEMWRREYKREMLLNNAWSNVILKAALLGAIDYKAQKLIYELVDDERTSINKQLNPIV